MIIGNDDGIAFTYDRGEHWRFVENLTLAQFYHISLDDEVPFNVYGGLQDNGSWYGPSTVWENRGILNLHWRRVGSGDGFAVFNDPTDARYGYSMSQQGHLVRFDKATGRRVSIRTVHPEGEHLCFNWNAGINVDPHDPGALYLGSQFVHRTRDNGNSWEIISPDLTTNDAEKQRQDLSGVLTLDATGAENHTTILSISPSPLQPGLIWASTDDGNVQITEDDGATWRNTGVQIRGVPRGTWVPHVEPSHHDPAMAYVVLEEHRRGNWEAYVYKIMDMGVTCNPVNTTGIEGFVDVIHEDKKEANLLFLGTEFGLHVSLGGGGTWIRWTHGVTPAPVRDLRIHARDHDLVVGTHGRGAYVIDDIRPLREAAADSSLASDALRVLPIALAHKYTTAESMGYRSVGHAMMFGETRPYGALINYWVGAEETRQASIDILDLDGTSMWTTRASAEPGMNRVVWNLRRAGENGSGGQGSEALAGTYTVRVTIGDAVSTGKVTVLEDIREDIPLARRIAKLRAVGRTRSMTTALREAQQRLERAIRTTETVQESLRDREGSENLREEGAELQESLGGIRERLFSGPPCQVICGRSKLPSNVVRRPLQVLGGSPDEPTPNERLMLTQAAQALQGIIDEVNRAFDDKVSAYSRHLQEAGSSPFPEADPMTISLDQG